jgi:DMSO/TMAO reductase YedYZ heme-binding membrane subunit
MFLTSNNLSVKRLGKWWKRLHRVVYIVVWLLVLHTGLQRISVWTYFIGVFAVLEIGSLIYNYLKKKQVA